MENESLSIEEIAPLFSDWYEMNPALIIPPAETPPCIICGAPNQACQDFIK